MISKTTATVELITYGWINNATKHIKKKNVGRYVILVHQK